MKKINPTSALEKQLKNYLRLATYAAADDRRASRLNDGKPEKAADLYESYANVKADKATRQKRTDWIKYGAPQVQIFRQMFEDYCADINSAQITQDMGQADIIDALEESGAKVAHIIVGHDFTPHGVLASAHDNNGVGALIGNRLAKYISQPALVGKFAEYFTLFVKKFAATAVIFCWETCKLAAVFRPILRIMGVPDAILDEYAAGVVIKVAKKKS
jgi:hypothetical protein